MSTPQTQTADGEVYEVFAKFQADEPPHHVGSVIATDRDLARLYAYHLYDEWAWHEMFIVPRQAIVTLLGPG